MLLSCPGVRCTDPFTNAKRVPLHACCSCCLACDVACAAVPRSPWAAAGQVGATAGLRLLPDGKADEILAEVRKWLRKHPFKVRRRVGCSRGCNGLRRSRGQPALRPGWPQMHMKQRELQTCGTSATRLLLA